MPAFVVQNRTKGKRIRSPESPRPRTNGSEPNVEASSLLSRTRLVFTATTDFAGWEYRMNVNDA